MKDFNYRDRTYIQVIHVVITHGYRHIDSLQDKWIRDVYERIVSEVRTGLYRRAISVDYFRPPLPRSRSYAEFYHYDLLIMLPTIKTIPFDSSVRSELHDYLKTYYHMPTLYLGHDGEKIHVENILQPYIDKGFMTNQHETPTSISIPLTKDEIDLFDRKSAYLELNPTRRNAAPIPPLTPL
jgi:hypothetical protein